MDQTQSVAHESFLDEDLSGVDPSMPLLEERVYDLAITKLEEVPSKDQTGTVLKITLKTTAPGRSVTGEPLNAGFPIFHNISLTPTEKYTKDAIKRACASFTQAAGGRSLFPLSAYQDKVVRAKVGIEKESTGKDGRTYPAKNVIRAFIKP